MELIEKLNDRLVKLSPSAQKRLHKLIDFFAIEKWLRKIPAVNRLINAETNKMIEGIATGFKPYKNNSLGFTAIPNEGRSYEEVITEIESLAMQESDSWQTGHVSGAVYHGQQEHIEFLNKVYALTSQVNPLHSDIWPSASKYEAEIVSMTACMLGKDINNNADEICGTVTSGGTESILLAMKTYRDYARSKGIKKPEMIVPITAHAAFDKAAQYFNIKKIVLPISSNSCEALVDKLKKLINKNTVVIVGSAPGFPHGVIDPIKAMSEIAAKKNIPFHVDACLGGFLLPFAKKLGYNVPDFDFNLPGVTSISVDTHKFGYAPKGTSVILYRTEALRHFQYYAVADWPGGLYFSPTFAGSRPGALSAGCWAAMISTGEEGYLQHTSEILKAAKKIKQGIKEIPELNILGDPLWVIAFGSDVIDVYQVMALMTERGWHLNGLHKPSCVHICVTLLHTQPGLAEHFIRDLQLCVKEVKKNPEQSTGMAPVYGMAASLPAKGVVSDVLKKYLDMYYKV